MTSIAEFTLPAGGFALGRVFEDHPAATLELDRVVPSADTVMPYFWVHAPDRDLEGVLAVFERLPELRSIVLMEDLGDRGLFRAEWEPDHVGVMLAIPESGVTVVAAAGSTDGWTFELRADDPEQFADFKRYCDDHAIDVTLARLQHLSDDAAGGHDLTPAQREALLLAYREGYFEAPRAIDQSALADRLGISRQALSARLRRGYRNLVASTLVTGEA